MDYSKFYHDWLQLDLVQGETPNFYQILGLRNMEPDVQKIEDAFRNNLDRLQNVNGMTNPEAYTAIASRVLKAHKVLMDPNQKHDYDLQLSESTGERVWKGYERPSFLTRVRQVSLITFGFILGLGVMVVMALSVDRNPDGSIIFHEEAQARKAPPFASQLDYVVYRPSIAQDYQPDGYTVSIRKPALKNDSLPAPVPSETAESKPEAQENLSSSIAGLENQSAQSEMDELSQILSGEAAPPVSKGTPKVSRRSPLYKMNAAANKEAPAEETASTGQDETPVLFPEVVDFPEVPEVAEVAEVAETAKEDPLEQETVDSLAKATKLLEKVRSSMDFTQPGAEEAYALIQYQILRKLCEADGILDQENSQEFTEYSLRVVEDLGWEKRFKEAYELLDTLKTLGTKKEMNTFLAAVANQRQSLQNYQKLYLNSLETLRKLENNKEDRMLNTEYAMWLWQETGEMQESIPYLAKCGSKAFREAASYEMNIPQSGKDQEKAILNAADMWWNIAQDLKSDFQISIVRDHAIKLYRKVDLNELKEYQRARVANL